MVNETFFMTRPENSETAEIVAARRKRLRDWIAQHHKGSQASFIRATNPQINQGELSGLLKDKSFEQKRALKLEKQAGMPTGYLANPLDTVDATIQAENDIAAIQMIVQSLAYSLRENLPSAARAFASHLSERSREEKFSDLRGMVASVIGIAQQDQSTAAASDQLASRRGSARKAS
jgi:hypothetical protein